MKVINLSEVA